MVVSANLMGHWEMMSQLPRMLYCVCLFFKCCTFSGDQEWLMRNKVMKTKAAMGGNRERGEKRKALSSESGKSFTHSASCRLCRLHGGAHLSQCQTSYVWKWVTQKTPNTGAAMAGACVFPIFTLLEWLLRNWAMWCVWDTPLYSQTIPVTFLLIVWGMECLKLGKVNAQPDLQINICTFKINKDFFGQGQVVYKT